MKNNQTMRNLYNREMEPAPSLKFKPEQILPAVYPGTRIRRHVRYALRVLICILLSSSAFSGLQATTQALVFTAKHKQTLAWNRLLTGDFSFLGELSGSADRKDEPVVYFGGKRLEVLSEHHYANEEPILDPLEFASPSATPPLMMDETLPAGTLIIAMDFALQDNDNNRLRRAYGLAVRLLHANVPLKWIINPSKTTRTGVDFTASARLRSPSIGGYSSRSFRTGPLAIFPGYEAQALSVISGYGQGIRVYELQSATTVPVHSDLTHKPKVLVEEDENPQIHTSILSAAGLTPGAHYNTGDLNSVNAGSCVTIVTVPHNSSISTTQRSSIRAFLQSGGNFFAQCAAIRGFQGSTPRAFLNAGFIDNPGISGFQYSNPAEPSAQFEGNIADEGGSQKNFGFNTQPPGGTRIVHDASNRYKAYTGRIDNPSASDGGYIHYLAGHDHKGNIHADRFYLNAVLRSAIRPSTCPLTIPTLTANNDQGVINCGNGVVTVNVLANDSNPQGGPLTVTLLGAGSNGAFVVNGDNTITYTGNVSGFWGGDQVTYRVCRGTICDDAILTIRGSVANQSTINGTVFLDTNTNGVLNGGESGASGITVRLYRDTNNNGVRDAGEPLLQSTTTAVGGSYSFNTNVIARFVIEVDASTLPPLSNFTTPNAQTANFTVLGQLDCNNNFGYITCISPPNAGSNGVTTLCPGVSNSPINFFDIITGEDPGGTWTETTVGPSSGVTIGSGTSVNFSNVPPGVYQFTYTVTAPNCPTATSTATVTVPVPLVVALDSKTDVSCNAATDGVINISVSGGMPNYSYLWSDGPTTQNRTGLTAGTYTVTVTDARGCTATLTETINLLSNISLSSTQTNISCAGSNNGSISVTAVGTNPPFNVAWSGPANGNPAGDEIAASGQTYVISGLAPGTYTVTVTDDQGCPATLSRTIVQPTALTASATPTGYLCFGETGAISLAVSGGTGARTYSWTGPGGFTATTQNISGLLAGMYNVTVTDANNCTATASATVTGPTQALSYVTTGDNNDVDCFGGADGSITFLAVGGTAPYTYQWSNGATVSSPSGLAAGSYTVTVTDNNGCTLTYTTTINQPPLLVLSVTKIDPTCPPGANPPVNSDGTINLTVTGGKTTNQSGDPVPNPYTFAWTTVGGSGLNPTAEDQTGLTAGAYSVTVTDLNGCTASISVTLTNLNTLPVAPGVIIINN